MNKIRRGAGQVGLHVEMGGAGADVTYRWMRGAGWVGVSEAIAVAPNIEAATKAKVASLDRM